jgi:hypothetical protein
MMQGVYGGLVVVMIYGSFEAAPLDSNVILTESSLPILTETPDELLTE